MMTGALFSEFFFISAAHATRVAVGNHFRGLKEYRPLSLSFLWSL